MAYTPREIKDRVAIGDDCFILENLLDGRIRLIPAPDKVIEPGTDINKALLQLIEDRIVDIMNRIYNDITSNPFLFTFADLTGKSVSGVWNETQSRIEC